jgi:hypothetical protein
MGRQNHPAQIAELNPCSSRWSLMTLHGSGVMQDVSKSLMAVVTPEVHNMRCSPLHYNGLYCITT